MRKPKGAKLGCMDQSKLSLQPHYIRTTVLKYSVFGALFRSLQNAILLFLDLINTLGLDLRDWMFDNYLIR